MELKSWKQNKFWKLKDSTGVQTGRVKENTKEKDQIFTYFPKMKDSDGVEKLERK